MRKLLSLPPNLVDKFHSLTGLSVNEYFCTSDPLNAKLGSGGGSVWLLDECRKNESSEVDFEKWLESEKRILLHAGGQSRRLPGYANSGKILTPIPVFRWASGQKLNQSLLSLQLPLYEKIMDKVPGKLHTLIASGDVYIHTDKDIDTIPETDVVCYGLWVDPSLAKNHGVFVSNRKSPDKLDFMLQKPSLEQMGSLSQTHLFLMDIGIWILSDKAVKILRERATKAGSTVYYDLYSDFGSALGANPRTIDSELNSLSVAILPLQGGTFYHYGTSRELISSTLAVQNIVTDQREIMHRKVKPHPAIFVQNAKIEIKLTSDNSEVWIENSHINKHWSLANKHLITGVPVNDWDIKLNEGVCIDVVPIEDSKFVARPYGFNDPFRGDASLESTLFLGKPITEWLSARGINHDLFSGIDIQSAQLFPICNNIEELGIVLRWMISESSLEQGKQIWFTHSRLSADMISADANLKRLFAQRDSFLKENLPLLAKNYERSIFYQLDLNDTANRFANFNLNLPQPIPEEAPLMTRVHDHIFRSQVQRLKGESFESDEKKAFDLLQEGLITPIRENKITPRLNVYPDQIVWGRSPVRIDLAGGWTDTPPYCLSSGGNVLNIAIDLNGQQPIQVYVKPCEKYHLVLRSIDLGAMEVISNYEELGNYTKVGSPFSIPKAALSLAGFMPEFSENRYTDLESQLKEFGCGIEVTMLAAIPSGSGLGTSSILAATLLGALSDFCSLNWDKHEICNRTLGLEQLLTTGGGWQDQYGGILHGVKLLQTTSGFTQVPLAKWLPDFLFTDPEYRKCHVLYYTGITRTAKNILAEIVRGMFLNSANHLAVLNDMKTHSLQLFEAIQRNDFNKMGQLIGKTWEQNKALDKGSNPPAVEGIIRAIDDLALGYKLPGAGGGGYLYIVAKDPEAAIAIRRKLAQNPPNNKARFVEMSLSDTGLQISRS